MADILVVTTSSAGSVDDEAVRRVVETLRRSVGDGRLRVVDTSDQPEVERSLAAAVGTVVVAGGDGSLHRCLNTLDRHGRLGDVVIGLVPLGTGNDFARGVRIPVDDPAAAARLVLDGVRREVDVVRDDAGDLVINAVHLGVGAEAGLEAQAWKAKLGRLGYVVGAVIAGVRTRGVRVRVVADGRVVSDGRRRLLQVAVGNGSFVGGGTPLVPDADPCDGALDVMVSFAVAPLERVRYALRLRRGRHPDRVDVTTSRTRTVEVAGTDLWLNSDGELDGPVAHRRWTLEPSAFTLMVPAADPTR